MLMFMGRHLRLGFWTGNKKQTYEDKWARKWIKHDMRTNSDPEEHDVGTWSRQINQTGRIYFLSL